MPMFVTLPVRDLAASAAWYEAAGFVVLATMHSPAAPDGPPTLVHLRRLRFQDLLLVPGEPIPGPQITFMAGEDDIDARAELLAAHLARHPSAAADADRRRVTGPKDTPWYTRDLVLIDPDGYAVVLTAARQADLPQDDRWRASVEESVGRRP